MSKKTTKPSVFRELTVKELVEKYQNAALIIENANFGPANFLYKPLRNAIRQETSLKRNFFNSFIKTFESFLKTPLTLHEGLKHSKILAAASYVNALALISRLKKNINSENLYLYNDTDFNIKRSSRFSSRLNLLSIFPTLVLFCFRLRRLLVNANFDAPEVNEIIKSFVTHKVYCAFANKILNKIQPECLLICNVNRSFELALWTEAKARGIKTVFLPYNEIELHPARFFSLCRGDFDLALVFSKYSSKQMQVLNKNINLKVVGFPTVINKSLLINNNKKRAKQVVLYIAGSDVEESFNASLLKECFKERYDIALKVRLHPNAMHFKEKFSWLGSENISNYKTSSLEEDVANASAVVTVNSTVSLDAILAGKPVIWITPPLMKTRLSQHPYRVQKLSNLEASSSQALTIILDHIFNNKRLYESEKKYQFTQICNAGYDRDWFNHVKDALNEYLQ